MPAWYEDDRFWTTFYPAMFHKERWEDADMEAKAVGRLLGIKDGADVLDFCCGPGRHALAMARMGFRVVGVDRTGPYLEMARRRAGKEGLEIAFVKEDVRSFRRERRFDAAVSLYTSFGYFEDPADDRQVLKNLHDSLRPGGKLLVDLSGKEVLARVFLPRSWSELEDGALLLEERVIRNGWERIENRWILIRGAERHEQRFSLRLYSGVELMALMLSVGFSSVELFGTLDGGSYDQTARRLAAVGVR